MSKFSWTDDEQLVDPDVDREPMVVTDLLEQFGVANATRAKKRAAVESWLADHEPNPVLRAGLDRLFEELRWSTR